MSEKTSGKGCGVLFGLPFAAVGVGCLIYLVYMGYNYQRVQSWVETPAMVQQAQVAENRDSDGDTTYRLDATFAYEYDGRSYVSDWVGLQTGSDNIGSWHHDRYAELAPYYEQGQPFRCFVNPEDPSEAILFRDLRIGFAAFLFCFALIFGSVGFTIMIGSLVGGSAQRAATRRESIHPTEPWTWRPEWAAGRIESSNKVSAYGLLVFAVFWNLISVPAAGFGVPEALRTGQYEILFVLIFPIIGIGILISALLQFARHNKYGVSVLQLDGITGVLGGYLGGTVHVPQSIESDAGVVVALRCVESTTSGSGKNKKTTSNTKWESEQIVHPQGGVAGLATGGVTIPFRFAIPYALPEPRNHGNPTVSWRLSFSASTPGLDYEASFEVPVFKTSESQPDFNASVLATDASGATVQAAMPLDPRTVRVDVFKDGTVFTYPRSRNLVAGIWMLVFALGFAAIVPFLYYKDAGWIFTGLWGTFSAGLLIAALYFLLNETVVEANQKGVSIRSSYLLFWFTRTFSPAEIAEIVTHSNVQIGDDSYYQIQVVTQDGKKHSAGSGFRNSTQAEQVVALMVSAMQGA